MHASVQWVQKIHIMKIYIRSDIVYSNEQNKQNDIRFHINEAYNEEMLIRVLLSNFTSKLKIGER